jgi:DNA helicase-2/ATP-dependent DNA helicase PcrA
MVFTTNDVGDLIKIVETSSEIEESKMVSDTIREQKMRNSYRNMDFAVLYRTNAQSRAVETELRRANIRYKIFGGLSFYRRKEIKDVTSYLKLAINPKDTAALLRVINYPVRGIGKASLDKLIVIADEAKLGLWEALCQVERFTELGRTRKSFADFVLLIKTFGIKARETNAYEAASYIAKQCGILKELHEENSVESLSRWENVQELLNAAKEFTEEPDNDAHTLDAFLAEISLFSDQDEKNDDLDFVTLMSIHASKGLEFPSVFVVGLEEELFPSFMSLSSRADLEEERRLFYVAVTRAKERLTLSYAKSRYKYGQMSWNEPSRFLQEIDLEYVSLPGRMKAPAPSQQGIPVTTRSLTQRPMRSVQRTPGNMDDFEGDDLSKLSAGQEVEHAKFGQGKVLVVDGNAQERKATVFFQDIGQKVLLLKYAKLKILN